MQCEECGAREARVNIVVVFNGKKAARRLCRECARKLQRGDALSALNAVLQSLEDAQAAHMQPCPVCGQTLDDMIRTGLMGCANCYEAFEPFTGLVLSRLNGAGHPPQGEAEANDGAMAADTAHATPGDDLDRRVAALRAQLNSAVAEEAYERAAVIRDDINRLLTEGEGRPGG